MIEDNKNFKEKAKKIYKKYDLKLRKYYDVIVGNYNISNPTNNKVSANINNYNSNKNTVVKKINSTIIIAIILIVLGGICIGFAFDYKENYYNHIYVGGDAYNYIINSNYFTGFIMLGSSLIICGIILISTSLLIKNIHKQ